MHTLWIVATPKLIASKTTFYILLYYSWFIKYDNVSSISEKRQDFSFLNAFCLVSIHRIVSEISSFDAENNFKYFNVAMPIGWSNIFSLHASAALSQAWWLCGGQWQTLSGRLFAITTRRTHFQKKPGHDRSFTFMLVLMVRFVRYTLNSNIFDVNWDVNLRQSVFLKSCFLLPTDMPTLVITEFLWEHCELKFDVRLAYD